MDKIVNTTYVPLQPPYKVIKHKNKIGVQIGTQMVTISGGSPFKIETHNYPVVAAEDRITPSYDRNHSFDASSEGEVWDNVETKQVSVLCEAGTPLSWVEFIKILWHDHARLRRRSEKINKVYIFEHLIKYNKCQELPSSGQYTIHLHTESSDGEPEVVRSAEDDVFALNIEWTDDTAVLEKKVVSDLLEYLLIISKNRTATLWRMSYETTEERLIPLVERLNANPQATSFKKTLMSSFVVKALLPYEETNDEEAPGDKTKEVEMAESVIDKISASSLRFYFEGWRNGKHGAICQWDGIYRFVEQARGKSGVLDDVKRNKDDNPIVAIGIVAYWLQFNSRMDTVIKRLTRYRTEIPKDIKEQFENYTKEQFKQFRAEHRDDPLTWDWDWEYQFYAKAIIPQEIGFNKQSEALFDYISDSDIALVRAVMNNYIKYLKKCRSDKGYRVSPELLVLRAVDSQDDTKYEDLEDYEVNTILDKLEKEGFIMVAWIEGHKPEGTRILDKGRAYLKQLEEGCGVVETKHVVREITWEDEKQCFKEAVLHVMEKKKEDGDYLFEKNTQWMAVYRFAIDIAIMYEIDDPREPEDSTTPQYKYFEDFAHELQLDVNPPTRLPFTKNAIDSINSNKSYVRYNTHYPWSQDGITDPRSFALYAELDDIYLALQEEYNNLIIQVERSL